MNRWWCKYEEEYYWVEVTRRDDLGENLKAPLKDTSNKEYWSYSLLKEMYPGDKVIHYHINEKAIVAVSEVSSEWKKETVNWTPSKKALIKDNFRPGQLVELRNFKRIRPIGLNRIQKKNTQVKFIIDDLKKRFGSSYFPFSPKTTDRPHLSTNEGYAFILTQEFVDLFPSLEKSFSLDANEKKSKKLKSQNGSSQSNQKKSTPKGSGIKSEKKDAIELHAVKKAIEYFKKRSYEVKEMPRKNFPYDLTATKDNEILHVEVKGRSVSDESVYLTWRERRHNKKNPDKSVLYFLNEIKCTPPNKVGGKYRTSGGKEQVHKPWRIEKKDLKATQYRYQIPKK